MTDEKHSGRIVGLQVENYRKLVAVDITPGGDVINIGGRNAQGKSSILSAIASGLGGADEFPDNPIRNGETAARIEIKIDDPTVSVVRTFKKNDKGEINSALVITDKEGNKITSPQTFLDKITSKLAFDPLAFKSLKPADQRVALIKLLGIDTGDIDKKRAAAYAKRTTLNAVADRDAVVISKMPAYPSVLPVDTAEISKKLEDLRLTQHVRSSLEQTINSSKVLLNSHKQAEQRADAEVLRIEKELERANLILSGCRNTVTVAERDLAEHEANLAKQPAAQDDSELKRQLATAADNNQKIAATDAKLAAMKSLKETQAQSEALTKEIATLDKQKADLIAAAEFPLEGLSFNDGAVLFGGLPLSEASDAEQIAVSTAMGFALNPKLKVLLIRDGCHLDDDMLAVVADMAKQAGGQVWVERVGKGAECSIIIEDGSVKEIRS